MEQRALRSAREPPSYVAMRPLAEALAFLSARAKSLLRRFVSAGDVVGGSRGETQITQI